FELLKKDKNSVLVDVRTFEEFSFVGTVDPQDFNGRMILTPWKINPGMKENPSFVPNLEEMLKKLFGNKAKEAKIIFMCRSGGRSDAAARFVTNLGYNNCYNLLSGFEGELDPDEHRGVMNGWKAEKLPWKQN
ncbi:MAG: rhodanese-like domain-containing protein, partial [Alphaproteobacteria bacterium]|nr:rhodanese-like domain-containing protein [Alphaproteobacteria bacterium]